MDAITHLDEPVIPLYSPTKKVAKIQPFRLIEIFFGSFVRISITFKSQPDFGLKLCVL